MKYFSIIICFICLFIIASPIYGEDFEKQSLNYLQAFKEKRFLDAAKQLHCPEFYSSNESEKDYISISKKLEIFYEEFGPLISAERSNTNLYATLTTACGTVPYWTEHPLIKQIVYETIHEGNSKGYIVLSFSKINGQNVLAWANHGLPMLGKNSITRIKEIFKRISSE
jgi:hypothetical protein